MSLEELIQRTVEEVRARAEEERIQFDDTNRAHVMEWAAKRFELALVRHMTGGPHRPKRGPQPQFGAPRPRNSTINIIPRND